MDDFVNENAYNNQENEDQDHVGNHRNLHVHEDDRPMCDITNSHASFMPQGFYAQPANFEIKGSLLANLPNFAGLAHEDPNKHILGVYHTCSSMKPPHASMQEVLLRVFQFSLEGRAKEWLLNLPTHYANLT